MFPNKGIWAPRTPRQRAIFSNHRHPRRAHLQTRAAATPRAAPTGGTHLIGIVSPHACSVYRSKQRRRRTFLFGTYSTSH